MTATIIALTVTLVLAIAWKLWQAQATGDTPPTAAKEWSAQTLASPVAVSATEDEVEEGLDVQQLIARGEMIEAIKLLRELHGIGLKEAHDMAQALRAGNAAKAAELLPAPPAQRLGPDQTAAHPEFQRLIAADKRIEAVKFYKDATRCGLKEAKEAMDRAVEEFARRQ